MSRYIDADGIDIRAREGYNHDGVLYIPYRDVRKSLDSAPSIDIVRCRECRYCDKGSDRVTGQTVFICQRKNDENLWEKMNADDFCSYGEREGE